MSAGTLDVGLLENILGRKKGKGHKAKGDFTLHGMETECCNDIAFFFSWTCVKVLYADTFLLSRFR